MREKLLNNSRFNIFLESMQQKGNSNIKIRLGLPEDNNLDI